MPALLAGAAVVVSAALVELIRQLPDRADGPDLRTQLVCATESFSLNVCHCPGTVRQVNKRELRKNARMPVLSQSRHTPGTRP